MIRATYWRQLHRVTVEGHALSDEPGKDLVCAAASALALTLAENAKALQGGGQARNAVTELDSGKAEVFCNPVSKYRAVTTLTFDAICTGFAALAKLYPDYISYEIR
jgi:uncharacterized protein YsxB (DUF464 family)